MLQCLKTDSDKLGERRDHKQRRDPNDKSATYGRCSSKTFKSFTKQAFTLDEQLLEYHGRVSFRQYIASKPGKFGFKICWVCDAETSYALHGGVYLGEMTFTPEERAAYVSVTEAITMKYVPPFLDCGRNITCDKWFTSLQLARQLLQRNTTILGTLRANRKEVPLAAKSLGGRQKKFADYFACGKAKLVFYWDKGSKPVLLLPPMHYRPSNGTCGILQPEVVESYNQTTS